MEQTLQKQEQLALHLCTDYQCKYKKKRVKKKEATIAVLHSASVFSVFCKLISFLA